MGAFGPTIDNRTVFDDVYAQAKAGDFVQKVRILAGHDPKILANELSQPLLVGTNHNEATLFTYIAYFKSPISPADFISLQNGFNFGAAEAAKARQLLDRKSVV